MKPFDDDRLRAYFLGNLPEREAEKLEEECAASAELTDAAQTVERELVDDFLRGNLSASEKGAFEANYPVTEARRHRLRTAQSLWQIAAEPSSPITPEPHPGFWQSPFSSRLKGFRFAFGAMTLLLVLAAACFYLLSLKANKNELAEVKVVELPTRSETPAIQKPVDLPVQSPSVENQNLRTPAPKQVAQNKTIDKQASAPTEKKAAEIKAPPALKTHQRNAAGFATFLLFSGSVRGDTEQSIALTPEIKTLNLLLNPSGEPNNYQKYRAVVKTAEGDAVFTSPNLKSLSFKIPAGKLENRTYIVFLEGQTAQGAFEPVSEYTFRVRR